MTLLANLPTCRSLLKSFVVCCLGFFFDLLVKLYTMKYILSKRFKAIEICESKIGNEALFMLH